MSRFIAALPMYDWPELRSSVDAEWRRLCARLLAAGIDAPAELARRNADLPAVPGGIRDASGRVIAPDPATLPPDGLDLATLWRHPALLLVQTCWGPLEAGLEAQVEVVGQPSYAGIEGGQGTLYSSAILMRRLDRGTATVETRRPPGGRVDVPAPEDGNPLLPLDLLRGKRLAFNVLDSMSGIIALSRDLDALGESIAIFKDRIETGSHRASIAAVAEGTAEACAVDCRSWYMAQRHEPAANAVHVVGWTGLRKGLPMVASRHLPPDVLRELRAVMAKD